MTDLTLKKNGARRLIGAVVLSIKGLLDWMSIFVVFSGGWTLYIVAFADYRLSYLIMVFVILAWLPFLTRIYFHSGFLLIFFIISLTSFYNISVGNNTFDLFIKQFTGIFLNAFFFYMLIKVNNYDIKRLFGIYMKIAFLVASIGIIQEISYVLGFRPGYDFSNFIPDWRMVINPVVNMPRLNSIFPEPSYFCIVMMPAFFASLASFLKGNFGFQKRWRGAVIIFSFFLTFSSTGYLGMIFCIALMACAYRRARYLIFGAIVMFIAASLVYNNLGDIKFRVKQSVAVIKGEERLEGVNSSTFALITNARVAVRSFMDNALFGTGLGSHKISYYKLIGECITVDELVGLTFLNVADASSFFLRLLSETGLLGILIIFIFIIRFYTGRAGGEDNYLWIINNAVLAMFFVKMVKMGHYFVDGFFFFLWLYYFSKIKLDEIKTAADS